MTLEKQDKPKRPQPAKDGSSVFVVRERLAICYSLRPPREDQKKILADNKLNLWPGYYEFKNLPAVVGVLADMGLSWSDSKGSVRPKDDANKNR